MNTRHDRPRVLVLFGGVSGEHPISCVTAGGVLRAIDRERYDVLAVGITRTGRWVEVSDDPDHWAIVDGVLPEVEDVEGRVILPQAGDAAIAHVLPESRASSTEGTGGEGGAVVGPEGGADGGSPAVLDPEGTLRALGPVDVVFPLLHGPYGEDGTLQGMLELAGVRYVGAGVLASAVSMDKQFMKLVLSGQGLPVGPYTVIPPGEWERDRRTWEETVATLGLPVFVKPARGGSSLGITRVTALEDLGAAIAAAREHDPKVLVEAEVRGREIECAVLGSRASGEPPRVSLPGEIRVHGGEDTFYDFGSKYLDEGDVDLICPADLPELTIGRVQDVARRAFEAVGCEGLARVDVFVTEDDDVIVNEINTMPGFTPISMYPRMWHASGIDYPHLVHELLQLALKRPTGLR